MVAAAVSPEIRVLVIDDHPIARAGIRLGLRRFPDIRVAWEAADGASGLQLAAEHKPDVAAIDVWLPDLDGFEVTGKLRDLSPETRVVIISGDVTSAMRARVSQLGIEGFFQKTEPLERLAALIRALGRRTLRNGDDDASEATRRLQSLTLEEHELLSLLAQGESLPRAAARMGLSHRSAAELKVTLTRKLDIHDRLELTHFAIQHQIVRADA